MAAPTVPAVDMIPQLEQARKLALGDPQVYNQVLPGIIPIIGPAASIDVRRWGADFLAEAFASPSLPAAQKEQLSAEVLPTLKAFLDNPSEDLAVVKSAVQAAASLYPLVFRRMYVNDIAPLTSVDNDYASNEFAQCCTTERSGSLARYQCH